MSILGLFYVLGMVTILRWGFDTPEGLLAITLAGIMTALLYETRAVWLIYFVVGIGFSVIAVLQNAGLISVKDSWKDGPYSYSDIVIYAATMAVIFAVTWLFNRQLHAAYLKSRASEEALREQSEHLEDLVIKRTEALRQEHFQRMADLHRFVLYGKEASGLLHDIINPLTALSIQMESLRKKGSSAPQVAQAQETLQRLEKLVTGARRHMHGEVEPEEVSFLEEVEAVFQSVQHRARANHIRLQTKGRDVSFFTDPILIYKILQNLIANSVDACAQAKAKVGLITVSAEQDASGLKLLVTDNGVGIPKSRLHQIFEPYFTTKNRDEGTGLGLSLIKGLIEDQLKGHISVESKQGHGTTVTVTLPLHAIANPIQARGQRAQQPRQAT